MPSRHLVLAVVLSATAIAGAQDHGAITTTRLTDRIYQLSTDQGEYTTNTLVSVGPDGVLVVDTQSSEVAEELKEVVEGFGKGTPKIIVNTHRHVEHVGGNAVFGAEPIVIAHDLVRDKLRHGAYLFEEFPDATLPDLSFADRLTLYFNGERIELIAMPGSHDDNEIIVHFTGSKVVHLSSLANGFNFPSVDSDGSVLAFPDVVDHALEILPEDVLIVSGHNRNGTKDDLRAYREMLVATIDAVRRGLAEGKDVATLQQEKILAPWSAYAGSYVSPDEWISTIADALQDDGREPRADVFETVYHSLTGDGADAAIARYRDLREHEANRYELRDIDLLVVGLKLLKKERTEEAAEFLSASLDLFPASDYTAYTCVRLAQAEERLGRTSSAIEHARRALELEPGNEAAAALLARLEPATPTPDKES